MKKEAAIYARVSCEQQMILQTIQSQIAALVARVDADEYIVPVELQFIDEGYSGTTLRRPALERLRDTVRSGKIERIYIQSPDRLSRKFSNQILLVEEFRKEGVELIFLNRQLGDSPEDELLLHIQGIVAEYEREKMLERSRRGKLHSARSGSVSVLGSAPFGYQYLSRRDSRSGKACYEVIPHEADIVQKIFEWFGIGKLTISQVCKKLNEDGLMTRTKKAVWTSRTVLGILKNPAYSGFAAYGKTKYGPKRAPVRIESPTKTGRRRDKSVYPTPVEEWITISVPPIISPTLFETAQKQIVANQDRIHEHKRGVRFLLQGLLRCKMCGCTLYGKPAWNGARKNFYVYYRCRGTDSYRFGGEHRCDNRQIRQEALEEPVWEEIMYLLSNSNSLQERFEKSWTVDRREFKDYVCDVQLFTEHIDDLKTHLPSDINDLDWEQKRNVLKNVLQKVEIDLETINLILRVDSAASRSPISNPLSIELKRFMSLRYRR